MHPGFTAFRSLLIVFAQPAASAQPGQHTLYHPPPWQHLKVVATRLRRTTVSSQPPVAQQFGQYQLGAVPTPVSWHGAGSECWPREPPRPRATPWCPLRYGACVRRPSYRRHSPAAPFIGGLHRLASILEQSGMAALGVASRPAASRTRERKASATRSQVPSSRHWRKYHHTVPQGGRSWGIRRRGMPPRLQSWLEVSKRSNSHADVNPTYMYISSAHCNCAHVPEFCEWSLLRVAWMVHTTRLRSRCPHVACLCCPKVAFVQTFGA